MDTHTTPTSFGIDAPTNVCVGPQSGGSANDIEPQKDADKPTPSATSVAEALKKWNVDPEVGLTSSEAQSRLVQYGPNALEEHKRSAWKTFLLYFWGPIPWMIEAAALMALVVQDWGDFIIISALLLFNALLGFWEEHEASNALDALKNSLALKARALRDGKWGEVASKAIVPGDIIRLYLGDVVPADCKLIGGEYLSIDQSALTGESLPVSKKVGDDAYSGSIVKQGEMFAVTTATGANTFFGRTAKLVAGAGNVSHFQKAVMKIGNFLIVVAVLMAIVLVIDRIFAMRGHFDHVALLRLAELVLILLVASVPVAMPAVLSVTMALGAQMLARKKAIVSRLESIEELAGIDTLCSDKTGTLTQNSLTLGEAQPSPGCDAQQLILMGSLASRASDHDPIDNAILAGLKDAAVLKTYRQEQYKPFDPVGKRTEATIKTADHATFYVTKGAPQVIIELAKLEGDDLARVDKIVNDFAAKGFRAIAVAKGNGDGNWTFLGILPLFDPPRPDSKDTIAQAKEYGVRVKMVTGDNVAIAKQISDQLGMGTNIQPATSLFPGDVMKGQIPLNAADRIDHADGFAQVFPEHKYAIVKVLQGDGHIVGMTGDGVNDAPALKQADVGIAVSGATDAARAAAALILTAPGLSVIIDGLAESRRIFERMMSYVLYRIAMTIAIMGFVVLASIYYGFFPLTALMLIALALLDDVPIMTIAFDNAKAPAAPVKWQMGRTLTISSVLGLFAVVQSFGLLYLGDTVYKLDHAHLQTMMFLQLVAGGHLLLFVTRTRNSLWMPPYPNARLFWAIVMTQIVAVLMCGFGLLVPALSWTVIGLVWAYNLGWMVVQDIVKLGIERLVEGRVSGSEPLHKIWCYPLGTHCGLHQHRQSPVAVAAES
ncbi:MAG: plasma-membrane proton-efflux P-type ATPase [Planctomycetaceae bacterium]|nr:plasma-membrane proton-efflux P-type ATPase [Planctomycetaceae bacterium]